MIPQGTMNSLIRYRDHGYPTGDFLRAVLSNDLMEAIGRADVNNRIALSEICVFVHNEMPSQCHGSRKKYMAWIESMERVEAFMRSWTHSSPIS